MKRFHLHMNVQDLAANIRFYSHLFGQAPSVEKEDYAKWMLDDPYINFAISTRGGTPGVDHIGIQVQSETELNAVKQSYLAADADSTVQQEGANCCYAQSNKYWLTDPQGVAWEAFHTLSNIPTYGQDGKGIEEAADGAAASACCAPPTARAKTIPINIPVQGKSCC